MCNRHNGFKPYIIILSNYALKHQLSYLMKYDLVCKNIINIKLVFNIKL